MVYPKRASEIAIECDHSLLAGMTKKLRRAADDASSESLHSSNIRLKAIGSERNVKL